MELEVGKYYMTRNFQTVKIVDSYSSNGVLVFFDSMGRAYFIDGVPTSGGVSDGFRIVGELPKDRKELEEQFKPLSGTIILNEVDK